MREIIIQAIKNTFGLIEEDSLSKLKAKEVVQQIVGLTYLLECLSKSTTPPKVYSTALEVVIVNIKLKEKPTEIEQRLFKEVQTLIYKPMYEVDKAPSHPRM